MKLTINEIGLRLQRMGAGITLISEDYKNAHTPIKFRCNKCSHEFMKSWSNIQSLKQYCPKCGIQRRWQTRRKPTIDDVYKFVSDNFRKVTVLETEYINAKHKMKCYCNGCKSIFHQHYNGFQSGKGCKNCGVLRRSGEKHYKYNPDLSYDERTKTREMIHGESKTIWRMKVHKAHRWRCVVCGIKKDIIAHHLDSYADFPDKRFDVDNGATICSVHHKDFHKKYGYQHNTKEQFEEYLKTAKY